MRRKDPCDDPEFERKLAAKGALAHHLQRRNACKIQNGRQGAQKLATGSGKMFTPRFLGVLSHFRKIIGPPHTRTNSGNISSNS